MTEFYVNENGDIYTGDMQPGDRMATEEEVDDFLSGKKATLIRTQRDMLLAQADILINKAEDAGQDTTALRQYRQALRDVPEQAGFPESIVWPEISE